MNKSPLLFLNNNQDEIILFQQAFNALKLERTVHYFVSGKHLIEFLQKTPQAPFMIISDVYLQSENVFDLKTQISTSPVLVYKTIPFVYLSAVLMDKHIQLAYDVHAQGIFFKPAAFDELCDTLLLITEYWEKSKHPMPVV